MRVGIAEVQPHPLNARQGDVGAISESLQAHGQYRSVVAQKTTGFILGGSHTWKAMKALGHKEIDVEYVDVDDDEALRIMLVDNRTPDKATYDENTLAQLLAGMNTTAKGLLGTGYDGDAVDDLFAKLNPPTLDELTAKFGDPDAAGLWPVIRMKVPPDLFDRFGQAIREAEGADEVAKLRALLDRAAA